MKSIKHLVSKIIFGCGLIAMELLTVPEAILFGMIALIRAATDVMTQKIE